MPDQDQDQDQGRAKQRRRKSTGTAINWSTIVQRGSRGDYLRRKSFSRFSLCPANPEIPSTAAKVQNYSIGSVRLGIQSAREVQRQTLIQKQDGLDFGLDALVFGEAPGIKVLNVPEGRGTYPPPPDQEYSRPQIWISRNNERISDAHYPHKHYAETGRKYYYFRGWSAGFLAAAGSCRPDITELDPRILKDVAEVCRARNYCQAPVTSRV
ncbi:hypothetical protein TESG_06469 [Trichophyton tonsurans CBS 112818]|uniref:Uncharacterized protein n=1 Tax=Trichophyton tonsurans (strain CBS 112818) TaxID=647933 RepID=F2S6D1_TRIT1|nr:hypothetical protein TESG_06469 [Trichophyton tonsurans CBS 112818]